MSSCTHELLDPATQEPETQALQNVFQNEHNSRLLPGLLLWLLLGLLLGLLVGLLLGRAYGTPSAAASGHRPREAPGRLDQIRGPIVGTLGWRNRPTR